MMTQNPGNLEADRRGCMEACAAGLRRGTLVHLVARFAGSQHLDARRRRRLAVENDGQTGRDRATPGVDAPVGDDSIVARGSLAVDNCPLLGWIRPELWRHLTIAAAAWLGAFVLLALGAYEAAGAAACGPGYTRLFGLSSARALGWYHSVVLLAAGQGALLVWWARGRSWHDFAGNYRIWRWTTAFALAGSFAHTTGAHWAVSETVLACLRIKLTAVEAASCWMLPALCGGAWLFFRLEQEMRPCRSSHAALLGAAGAYLLTAFHYCGAPLVGLTYEPPVRNILLQLLLATSHASLLATLTLHARYVLYVSAEPPPELRRQAGSVGNWVPGLLARLGALVLACVAWVRGCFTWQRRSAVPAPRGAKRGKRKTTTRKPRAKPRTAVRPPVEEEPEEELVEDAEEQEEEHDADLDAEAAETEYEESAEETYEDEDDGEEDDRRGAAARESSWDEESDEEVAEEEEDEQPVRNQGGRNQGQFRFDQGHGSSGSAPHTPAPANKDDLKGLSKRERRKLQQQQREAERQSRRGN